MIDLGARFPIVASAMPRVMIEAFSQSATLINARAGRTVIGLNTISTSVYLVLEGRVQAGLCSMGGREVILRDLSAGALFGDLAAIDGQPRSASIVATGDCKLASLPGDSFREATFASSEAALWLGQRLVRQVRELTDRVFELNALRVPSRLHCELLRLGVPIEGSATVAVIDPSPTHAELAARIGTHREAITRELGFLGDSGIVTQQRRRLTIVDVPALAKLVRHAGGAMDGEG